MRLLLVWDPPGPPGAHVRCRVFSGPDADHLALNGALMFDDDTASDLAAHLTDAFTLRHAFGVDESRWELVQEQMNADGTRRLIRPT